MERHCETQKQLIIRNFVDSVFNKKQKLEIDLYEKERINAIQLSFGKSNVCFGKQMETHHCIGDQRPETAFRRIGGEN